jgi:hypothetical protein
VWSTPGIVVAAAERIAQRQRGLPPRLRHQCHADIDPRATQLVLPGLATGERSLEPVAPNLVAFSGGPQTDQAWAEVSRCAPGETKIVLTIQDVCADLVATAGIERDRGVQVANVLLTTDGIDRFFRRRELEMPASGVDENT